MIEDEREGRLRKSYVKLGDVAHAYNPSYSAGRDQEDGSSKPAWANSWQDPISKKPITKMGWWSGLRYRLEPKYCQKKKKSLKKHTSQKIFKCLQQVLFYRSIQGKLG
jgi:hypothetical protein